MAKRKPAAGPPKRGIGTGNHENSLKNLEKNRQATQFQPGQSGNPDGTPRKFTTLLSQAIQKSLAVTPEELMKRQKSAEPQSLAEMIGQQAVLNVHKKLKRGALNRDIYVFFSEFMDRTEGKVTQPVSLPELAKLLDGRSPEELDHFATYGHFPGDPEPESTGAVGSKSPRAGTSTTSQAEAAAGKTEPEAR